MWFDVQSNLKALQHGTPANPANPANPEPRLAEIAGLAAPQATTPKTALWDKPTRETAPDPKAEGIDPDARMFEHGTSAGGRPRTWTGRVVSLAEWRGLTGWQRHGPDGRHWCGLSKAWKD